ncbi:MAG: hypothetical protein DI546_07950 [Rhizobium sp.]|nr:MAG: hypothetical protein DI546_07950 [Rhizobium sp.]
MIAVRVVARGAKILGSYTATPARATLTDAETSETLARDFTSGTAAATGALSEAQKTATSTQWVRDATIEDTWLIEVPRLIANIADPIVHRWVKVQETVPLSFRVEDVMRLYNFIVRAVPLSRYRGRSVRP